MPVIAIEEDDLDEVSRLLSEVPVPDIICPTTISIGPPSTEDTKEDNHHRQANNEDLGGNNQYDANDDDDDDAESFNSNSTFELCSISSYENLADYNKNNNNNNDSLNLSISRSGRSTGKSLSKSIGNSSSSRNRYVIVRRTPSSVQLNRSVHSTGAKQLDDIVVYPKTDESIDAKYFIDYSREIGRGTKTIVRKCIERSTGNRYAVKSVKRSDGSEYEHMRTEANLLTALNHPSIIQIYDTYEDDKYLHMVVEICKGGELYDHVVKPANCKKKNGSNQGQVSSCPSEEVVAIIVRRVVDAVAYLHDHNIIHRDLKVRR
uniref:Protein kinase domain-containing protein n=1 Tax=Pseudo-nitzschia australis TaxID=44445 RepID=A0A7S4ARL9_9STRA